MFGRRRIRELEAQVHILRQAIDWYSVNDNWKRRGTNPPGTTPRRWTMSPAQKDHGGRARAAAVQADAEAGAARKVTVPQPLTKTILS